MSGQVHGRGLTEWSFASGAAERGRSADVPPVSPSPLGTGGRARAYLARSAGLVALHAVWLLCALPVVTWMTSSAAMVHSLDRWLRCGDDRLLLNFRRGWRAHVRRTAPLGAVSSLVLALLLVNLLFLMTRTSAPAVVLLIPTIGLLLMWAVLNVSLVPVVALFPDLSTRAWLREGFVMAFRHPASMTGVVLGCLVVSAALYELFAPLVVLGAGLTAYLALGRCYRSLERAGRADRRASVVGGAVS